MYPTAANTDRDRQSRPRAITLFFVSPLGLASVTLGIFLLAWTFPPSLYSSCIHEPDLLFLNPGALIFFSLCIGSFASGVWLLTKWLPIVTEPSYRRVSRHGAYFVVPLSAATAYCFVYLHLTIANVDIAGLFASRSGNLIKLANVAGTIYRGQWSHSVTVLTAVLWWSAVRRESSVLSRNASRTYRVCYIVAFVVLVLTCILRLDRGSLIPALLGLGVISIYIYASRPAFTLIRLLSNAGGAVALTMAGFVAAAWVRGAGTAEFLASSVIGYSVTSYNRMAALVGGTFHYLTQGSGIYLVNYLEEASFLNDIFHFKEAFGWPDRQTLLIGEFFSVLSGGLNPLYNWASFPGYIYSDIGWLTPVYMLGIGALTAVAWRSFNLRHLPGVLFYPWFAYSALFWFGANVVFEARFVELGIALLVLYIYERSAGTLAGAGPGAV